MKFDHVIIQQDMEKIASAEYLDYEILKGKTVLVTGASGMLACYIVYFLMYLNREKSYNITVKALVRNEKKAWDKFGEFRCDKSFQLMVQDVCEPIFCEDKVDYIFHLAGNASPQFILNDPVGIIRANTIGTLNVMELAKRAETKRVFYASTREVYGKINQDTEFVNETLFGELDCLERRACYPESKRIAESILQSYYYQYGMEFVIGRIAHSYGPGMSIENDGRVMADFISDVVHDRNIILKSKGEAVRAFCYITDAVSAIFAVMLKGENGEAYNIANETEPITIRKTAQDLLNLFPEKKLKLIFEIPETMSAGYSKMGRTALDTSKLEKLGWKPCMSLIDGMKRTVESFGV